MSAFFGPNKIEVTPYSTTITSTSLGLIPPLSPTLSPTFLPTQFTPMISQNIPISPFSPTLVIPTPLYALEVNTGLNENPFAQKQMLDFIMAKVYNKWVYGKDMCYLLKYLQVVDGKVKYLSSIENFKNNKICDDSESDVEMKIDFIEKNILPKSELKKLLKRMIDELGFKWFEFPQKLDVIQEAVERHIKKALKNGIGTLTN